MIYVVKNTATAASRRIGLLIYDDTGLAAWAGSVTGVKAQLSNNAGAEAASTNDIVRVAGALHYAELTQAESDGTLGVQTARVAAAAGRLEAVAAVPLLTEAPTAAAATTAEIATAVWASATRTLTSFGTLIADIWANVTRTLSASTNIVLAKGTGVTGFNDPTSADIASTLLAATINSVSVSNLLASAGGANFSISGTTLTVRNLAGATIFTRTLTLAERNAINASAV